VREEGGSQKVFEKRSARRIPGQKGKEEEFVGLQQESEHPRPPVVRIEKLEGSLCHKSSRWEEKGGRLVNPPTRARRGIRGVEKKVGLKKGPPENVKVLSEVCMKKAKEGKTTQEK